MRIVEENFIEEMKKGNEEALEYVIDNYGWILKTVLKKHLFYIMDYYDECMNDCLLAIWQNIENYDPDKSSFKNWVGGIGKYKSIDYTRKYLKDLETKNIEDFNISTKNHPLKEIFKNEVSQETEKMLNGLSKENREIFKKIYFEDKNMDEISKDTGFSKSVLYNRLSRGRKKMRNKAYKERGY